jgi:hypothetical protein
LQHITIGKRVGVFVQSFSVQAGTVGAGQVLDKKATTPGKNMGMTSRQVTTTVNTATP